jgi:hypothetical protein
MNTNESVIISFYEAFQKKDVATMQDSYSDLATFSDPVFRNLSADQVRKMWEMLVKRGKDMKIEFSNVKADHQTGSADWVATYTFSGSGRMVTNKIHAEFEFIDGKILQHTDDFDFHNWAKQALGLPGQLLGWTRSFHNKVSQKAMESLHQYMKR